MYEAGGNPSLGRREPSKGPGGQWEDKEGLWGRGREGIAAAVWRKHDGAAGVARSASHAHYLGVDNDFGVTLASLWYVLAINANMARPRLSNGRALTSARQLKANQRPSGGWDSAGVRAGERWISHHLARLCRRLAGNGNICLGRPAIFHLPPVCAERALGQRPLRRLATMTNQRFVWRSWERRSQALSLQICTKPRACDIFCLLPRYGQDLLG
ncbi:uncharacterized protein K441DRAFT_298520 [Cenococcum geophilum 1.58]|uniref:uncharacterized protein n=1 Tax=Cenococcum geophilum 1.58 TaxID=794803 RepID=UPI00358F463A|nr:hypothetical protein K441DRAFT_298520 [Cenococcum geophilum 1.58]